MNLLAAGNIIETGARIHLNGPKADSSKCPAPPSIVPNHEPWTRPASKMQRGPNWKGLIMAYSPTSQYSISPVLMDDVKKGTSAPSVNVNIKISIVVLVLLIASVALSNWLIKKLVNRDLLNHIYTIPGERIGRPDFGTVIPMLAFEQADPKTISIIERELKEKL